MVNKTDARKIAVDTSLSLVVEVVAGLEKSFAHVAWENLTNATIWHYALRDTIYEMVGEVKYKQALAKGATLAVMSGMQYWADGHYYPMPRMLLYGATQALGEYADPMLVKRLDATN